MLSPKDLAELLCVSSHSLQKWRCLPPDDPRYLPAFPQEGGNPQTLFYAPEDILKWANHRRNAKYLDRILGALAPPELRQALLPQATHAHQVQQLRGVQPAELALGAGLFAST